jgi:hypothetical protein
MAVTATSPNPDNYYIGRGIVWWKAGGVGAWRDLGNAPSVQFKANIKKLDHFSSRLGLKTKDKAVVIEANATVTLLLEEWTPDNLALAMMGVEGTNPFDVLGQTDITGSFFFLGTNQIGAKLASYLPIVSFTPGKTLDFISADKYGDIELIGDVLSDPVTGKFGTTEWNTAVTAPP